MYRRDFLKFSGLLSATFLMKLNSLEKMLYFPVQVSSRGMLYRGTSDGRIYRSMNEGQSWELHTNFGTAYSVLGLEADLFGQVYTQLDFGGHSFELTLAPDGKLWRNE